MSATDTADFTGADLVTKRSGAYVYLLFNPTLTQISPTGSGICWVRYDPSVNQLALAPDSGFALGTPFTNGNSDNSQCTVTLGSGSGALGSTANFYVTVNFKSSYNGAMDIYLNVSDSADGPQGTQTYNVRVLTGWHP